MCNDSGSKKLNELWPKAKNFLDDDGEELEESHHDYAAIMVTTRNKAAVPATKPVEKPAKKITFDSDDEDEAVNEAIAAKSQRTEEDEEPTKPTEEDEESDSDSDDDDAPEAVTVSSGREAAKQKEEEARRAIEAYQPHLSPIPLPIPS